MAEAMKNLWNAKDVSKLIGMSESFVVKQAEAGLIPSLYMGRKRRFRPESVEAYVKALENGSSGAVDSSVHAEPELSKAS